MRTDLALCAHLAAVVRGPAPFTLAPDETLSFDGGPVEAVVRCRECGACGWLERAPSLAGPAPARHRLAALRAPDVALFFRNRARGSCDVGRARAELEALVASAGPWELVLVLDPHTLEVEAVERCG